MAPSADPYRTLGLARGAPLADVKKAYRRLAKIHHPDAAGEGALPRFLAIQAAYDQIVGTTGSGTTGKGATGPRRPWEADPGRADATHRAYGARSRRTRRPDGPGSASGSSGTRSGSTDGAEGRSRRPRGDGDPAGSRDDAGSGSRSGRSRPPNKATLGSTSYDGAEAEPFEPDWGGASWYGTTSGTYWTLNPKEYADPRKHGPEYQARARRAAAAANAEADAGALADDGPAAGQPVDAAAAQAPGSGIPGTPPPTHTTSSWWDATQGPATATADEAASTADPAWQATATRDRGPTPSAEAAVPERPAGSGAWAWLEGDRPPLIVRLARAGIGWVPIALAIGWVGDQLTGCGRASATCDPIDASMLWLAQVAALAVLILVPRVAAIAATAAIVALVVAVPVTLVLSAPASPDGSDLTPALTAVTAIAWVVGAGGATVRASQRRSGPVS